VNTLSNFILTLQLDTQKYQEDILNKRLEIGRNIYNACLKELYRRYDHMKESKEYRKIVKMDKGKERNKKFNEVNKKYGLTEYSLHEYVKPMQHHFKKNIDSFTAQKIATRCFKAFQNLIFHKSSKVYFEKYGKMNSVEGKSNKTGIRYKDNTLLWNDLEISVIIKKNDEYAHMALLNRVKYCRVVRKFIRDKYKYYIQLVLDGIPPMKINKETGEIKNSIGTGNVGIDIGTQTIAISSEKEVKLLELAPQINNIEIEKRKSLRKLDRQRRVNNPNKYNTDGTIKRGNRDKWIKSNNYIKTQHELREIQRKQADIRKQSHNILANYILSLGNRILVEEMNYKGLQSRAKETTINKKGKFNKKKRFGKSLANKAPSMLLTIIDNKLKWHGEKLLKINTKKIKASQYNHIEDKYIKKKLSARWNDFGEFKIQRDIYSAFIIQNVIGNKLDTINKKNMIEIFDKFKTLHDIEIQRIKNSKSKLISSMGI
jgi:hypothetical protein